MEKVTEKIGASAYVGWMVKKHLPAVLRIEESCFDFHAWKEEDFIKSLRQRNCIGMTAEIGEDIVGYMIYELHKNRLHILNFAVDPAFHRQGVGTAMIEKLKGKLSSDRRNRLLLDVRETNLDAQLFFKAQGFKAINVLRDFYDDTTEDAYLMQYRCESDSCW